MKTVLSLGALIFLVLLGLHPYAQAYENLTAQQAKDMIDTNDQLIVVDVRTVGEYCPVDPPPGHIPGALNYPYISGEVERWEELSVYTNRDILVVCQSGGRSAAAAAFLEHPDRGFTNIINMLGGMNDWQWPTVGCIDSDSDGINDDLDNCPDDGNPNQENGDSDELGDVCDNCPEDSNPNQEDGDGDEIGDICDNCLDDSNPNQEDVDCDGIGDVCDGLIDCTEGIDCDNDCDGVYNQDDNCQLDYNPGQEDTFPPPPGNNNIGDACDCEGNFDCDDDVDGTDANKFKTDFGRSSFFNPCTTGEPCNGDLDCDADVDGTDAMHFKADFGRSQFFNTCPACVIGAWCVYP